MAGDEGAKFTFPWAVRGFPVYRGVWVPHLGQRLGVERKHGNVKDRFAVAVTKHRGRGHEDSDAKTIVGHLPRELSQVLWYFLFHEGEIDREVTGRKAALPACPERVGDPMLCDSTRKEETSSKTTTSIIEKDSTI